MIGASAIALALFTLNTMATERTVPGTDRISVQTSWGKMGQGTVEPTENGVSTLNAEGRPVHAIKFKVLSGGVNLHRCDIYFNDGSKKSVELRNDVPAGTESREINLAEAGREVTRIVFWYDTRNYRQKALVELWGKSVS